MYLYFLFLINVGSFLKWKGPHFSKVIVTGKGTKSSRIRRRAIALARASLSHLFFSLAFNKASFEEAEDDDNRFKSANEKCDRDRGGRCEERSVADADVKKINSLRIILLVILMLVLIMRFLLFTRYKHHHARRNQ